jgi:hypothetical protein
MSITSTEILEDSAQADGSRHIGVKFNFHNGQEVVRRFWVDSLFDTVTDIAAMEPGIEAYMIEQDDEEVMAQIEKGNIAPLSAQPVHPETISANDRKKRLVRKLLRKMMQERDMKLVRKMLYPIWKWLKYDSGFTATQIANYFNISLAKLGTINSRFQAIHDNLTMIDADDGYLGEVD